MAKIITYYVSDPVEQKTQTAFTHENATKI